MCSQEDIQIKGHAIECRINAEDPFQNFRPGPGRVVGYLPPGGPHVRMDSHLYPGGWVGAAGGAGGGWRQGMRCVC